MKLFHSSGLEGGNIPKLPHREIPAVLAQRCLAPASTRGSTAWGRWLSEEPFASAPYAGTRK